MFHYYINPHTVFFGPYRISSHSHSFSYELIGSSHRVSQDIASKI